MTLPPDAASGHDGIDEDSLASTPEGSKKQEWLPTETVLNKFLDALSPDREKSAAEYEKLRTRLIRFFEWRRCSLPETRADQTIDRVMRKLDEGRVITNLMGFVFAVARRVAKEDWREDHPSSLNDDESSIPDALTADPLKKLEIEEEPDRQLICFDNCLERMLPKWRNLILSYYKEDGRAKIDWRKQLAKQMGISLNVLRIRAHRIRKSLEQCIENCLAQPG
jgi:DNA-directed RNA polymerase specialized sigma24 family protein